MALFLNNVVAELNDPANDGFFPVLRSSDMKIKKFYRVNNLQFKTTTFGERSCLNVINDDEDPSNEMILFLSPVFSSDIKKALLKKLFEDPTKAVFVSVVEIKTTEKGLKVPIYNFKVE
jgi:hypothetical protein